jgi:hypothetical protein
MGVPLNPDLLLCPTCDKHLDDPNSHCSAARGTARGRPEICTSTWSHTTHWNRGRHQPCRLCGNPSFLLGDIARPAHKVCVEDAVMNRRHLQVVRT